MTKLINLTDLAKKTWSIYLAKFDVLFGLMALPFTLFIISPLLAQVEDFLSLPFSLLLMALASILMLWSGTAAVIILRDREDNLSIKKALKKSQSCLWPVVWVAIITCFIIGGASMLFLIPGLILSIYFIFAKIIVITEKENGLSALLKSREYVRGYFWPIVGRYLVIVVTSGIILVVLNKIDSLFIESLRTVLGSSAREALLLVSETLVNIVVFPLMLIPTYLLYENVRKVRGDIVIKKDNKQGLIYLGIGLAGWIFLMAIIFLAIIILTTAIGGYLLGAFVTEIFNNQYLIK